MGPKAFAGNPSAGRPPGPPPPVSYESFWMLSKAHPIALYPLKGRPSCERPRTHPSSVSGSTKLPIVVVSGQLCLPAALPSRFLISKELNFKFLRAANEIPLDVLRQSVIRSQLLSLCESRVRIFDDPPYVVGGRSNGMGFIGGF
jgi:hypothetical protein